MEPPPIPDPSLRDREHLQLLALFHLVLAGLGILGLGFLALHGFLMGSFVLNEELWKKQPNPPPREFLALFMWLYWIGGFCIVLGMLANVLSGLFIRRRRHRVFSLVVAGLNCLQFPFGTALGVFTFVVLLRESVVRCYDERAGAAGG